MDIHVLSAILNRHVFFANHDHRHALPILYHVLATLVYDFSIIDHDYVAIVGDMEI